MEPKRPDGGFAVFAPNAHGGRVVTFSRSLVAEIASAAVAALMEPTPNDRTHTEAETFLDLINNGDAERLASFHYGNMARTGGSIMVAPEDVAWDHYTFKRELLQPRSDNEPADISEALRWCVVVDNIPECDADTAGIIYIERERDALDEKVLRAAISNVVKPGHLEAGLRRIVVVSLGRFGTPHERAKTK